MDYIHSSSQVNPSANIIFDAGNEIELHNSFEVRSGAIFHAFIDGCPDN